MNSLRRFMYGRYGMDRLNQVLIGITLGISLMGSIFQSNLLVTISYIPLLYGIYRALSKDIVKRSAENRKFLQMIQKIKTRGNGSNTKNNTHRYYSCPSCGQSIRVPKGKGKICITCPKCRKEFVKRT